MNILRASSGVIKQTYLSFRGDADRGIVQFTGRVFQIATGIVARYVQNGPHETLDIVVDAAVFRPADPKKPKTKKLRDATIFVSVIDESSEYASNPGALALDWATLRGRYPEVPFFLLWPDGGYGDPIAVLHIPAAFLSDENAYLIQVPRTEFGGAPPPTWLDYMEAAAPKMKDVQRFNAYTIIDNSGSMTTYSVQPFRDEFQATVLSKGGKYVEIATGTENWIATFIDGSFDVDLLKFELEVPA